MELDDVAFRSEPASEVYATTSPLAALVAPAGERRAPGEQLRLAIVVMANDVKAYFTSACVSTLAQPAGRDVPINISQGARFSPWYVRLGQGVLQ